MTLRPCIGCGEPTGSTRCPSCAPVHARTLGSAHRRGYDRRWRALSARARRAQPFCTDCGTVDNLTVDHSAEAWARRARGQVIRTEDVAVVCQPCTAAGDHRDPEQSALRPTGHGARQGQRRQRVSRGPDHTSVN